ncbi:uncharacterized protein K444DRAFT_691428 [Hyaloscypha bicolor E]|uniref:Uncharacterized protein n=1 Tax=Hyaloscypha bicolor E TaxID=1095630 RepID=A0A2J6T4N2_9HELO|nr:uncharacterized protein K444DRAFT_691428 [Hyaloscypha bicolor E]PMD57893.1 hypothetical protein K444DRAFT_691428 [Hyaloscypha bicolor E]
MQAAAFPAHTWKVEDHSDPHCTANYGVASGHRLYCNGPGTVKHRIIVSFPRSFGGWMGYMTVEIALCLSLGADENVGSREGANDNFESMDMVRRIDKRHQDINRGGSEGSPLKKRAFEGTPQPLNSSLSLQATRLKYTATAKPRGRRELNFHNALSFSSASQSNLRGEDDLG